MLLPLLLCVLILYSGPLSDADVPAAGAAWATALLVAANAVLSWAATGVAVRAARRGPSGERRAANVFRVLAGLMVGLTAAATYEAQWPLAIYKLFKGNWVLVDDVVLLAPVLLMALTQMSCRYRFEAVRRGGTMRIGLGRYLLLRSRVELAMILAPWLVLMLVTDLAGLLFADDSGFVPYSPAISLGAVALIVVFSPFIIRWVWGTSPLPAGPFRERLESFCRRNSFRCNGLRVWHTERHLANAGVVGPTPLVRYVFLSDSLLENFTDDEVEAVLAHEVGHVRHHHMLFYVAFAFSFMLFYGNVLYLLDAAHIVDLSGPAVEAQMALDTALMLGFAIIYWGLGFGLISRRMEQQADLYAVDNIERPEAFIAALEKLAATDHVPRGISHWRHFSIDRRVRFLRTILADRRVADRFLSRLRRVKWAFLTLAVLALWNLHETGIDLF